VALARARGIAFLLVVVANVHGGNAVANVYHRVPSAVVAGVVAYAPHMSRISTPTTGRTACTRAILQLLRCSWQTASTTSNATAREPRLRASLAKRLETKMSRKTDACART
jgi:hypothetical protein